MKNPGFTGVYDRLRPTTPIQRWAHEESNFGPRPYQGRALTN
jgi:hypothetical protein